MKSIKNIGAGLLLGALFGGSAVAGSVYRLQAEPAPVQPEAIDGLVTDFDGEPIAGVVVTACGVSERSDARGHVALDAGCDQDPEALRQDGLLTTGPAYTTSSVSIGGERVVSFVFDPRPTGGLGLSVVGTASGVLVKQVLAGTPADLAGLRPGDLIVDVSEQLWIGGALRAESMRGTPGMRAAEFARFSTGPAGTPVSIVVKSRGQDPRALTLTRGQLLSDQARRY